MISMTTDTGRRRAQHLRTPAILAIVLACAVGWAAAQVVEPPFDADYFLVDLGPVPDLPPPNGGLSLMPGAPGTLVIAGAANSTDGALYTVGLVRDAESHVTGFLGPASFMTAAPFNDGGVAFGPDGVLFLSRFPVNEIGQTMHGSMAPDKVVLLDTLGVMPSPGGLNFVPQGFPGAGSLKIASWDGGQWYTVDLAPDGSGTFDLTAATMGSVIPGGPEGFVYVPAGSPQFPDNDRVLVSEWSDGNIALYRIDADGNPIASSREVFVSGLSGPEGATVDPLTGDFLFSTFTGLEEHVFAVRGFVPPEVTNDPGDPADPVCESFEPVGHGYWHRQCLGVSESEGGLAPGNGQRKGRGPQQPTEPAFVDELMPCANAMLADLRATDATACEALDPFPTNDRCERAQRDLASLVLNVCSDRVQASCAIEPGRNGCAAGTVGELLQQAADLIGEGQCRQAAVCLHGMSPADEMPADEDAASIEVAGPSDPEGRRPVSDARGD